MFIENMSFSSGVAFRALEPHYGSSNVSVGHSEAMQCDEKKLEGG